MIFIGIIGAVFLIDYFVKQQAEKELDDQEVREVAKGNLKLQKLYNRGIAFGLFEGKDNITIVATAVSLGAMIASFFAIVFKSGKGLTKLGYALLIGGGLNNLYERVTKGYVTDYFSFNVKWDKLKKMVFNVSDMFILIGTFFVLIGKLFGSKKA